jgi:hypothetical protein
VGKNGGEFDMKTKEMLINIASVNLLIATGHLEDAQMILHSLQSELREKLREEELQERPERPLPLYYEGFGQRSREVPKTAMDSIIEKRYLTITREDKDNA